MRLLEVSKELKIYHALAKKVIEDIQTKRINGAIKLLFHIIKLMITKHINTTEIFLHPETVANAMGTSSNTIRRWIKILMREKYLLKHPDKKGKHWYILNPYLFRDTLKGHIRDELWKKALEKENSLFQTEKNS